MREGDEGAISSVLIGASKSSQILDCAKAIENISFSAEELAAIDSIAPVK